MTKMLKLIRHIMLIQRPRPFVRIVETIIQEQSPNQILSLKLKETTCQRCDRVGHTPAYCIAKYDIAGYEIDEETSV